LHFHPRSLRITASNDGRLWPGGRADVPRGRGKIRRSGLNNPQLGTDAERENGGARANADLTGLLAFFVENVRQRELLFHEGPPRTGRLASPLDTFSERRPWADRGKRATGSSERYV
jgi:hypothetical protein